MLLTVVLYLGIMSSVQANESQQGTMKTGKSTSTYTHYKKGQKHHSRKKHQLGEHWKSTLSKEQKLELDKLHLDFIRHKAPLKAEMKVLKVQFTIQATSDQVSPEALETKINELVMVKSKILHAKAKYIAAQRKILTPEQRVSFDLEKIHKAMHKDKKDKKRKMKH